MTIEEAYRENWEPWHTEMIRAFTLTDSLGVSLSSPFSAHAETYDDANRTMMIHIGVCLMQEGHHPAWIKDS